MSVTEFAGRTDLQLHFPLGVGEVFGVRAWNIDPYGRLRSVGVTADPWRPGENVAACKKSSGYSGIGYLTFPSLAYSYDPGATYEYTLMPDGSTQITSRTVQLPQIQARKPEPPKVKLTKKPRHIAPVEECACGFYAYANEHHENVRGHMGAESILGIIRGTGRTLIGTRGFRCEKAEIVALLRPKKDRVSASVKKVARAYPEIPMYGSKRELFEAWALTDLSPDPSAEDFWTMP